MLNILKKLNSSGDTIVEVLVVLTVLGLAISVSYATANRSLLDARQAQESSQATEVAQAQVEALRTQASVNPAIFTPGVTFCLSATPPYKIQYPPNCTTPQLASPNSISVTYNTATAPYNFKIVVSWPDVAGQGNDTATLVYRLYQ